MPTAAMITAALALLCWPSRHATPRMRALYGTCRVARSGVERTRLLAVPTGLAVLTGALTLGVVTTGVLLAFAATACWRWRERARSRARIAAMAAVADAVGGLVAELRAGAHPAGAAESTAADLGTHHPAAAAELRAIAAAARLGCDATTDARTRDRTDPVIGAAARIARGWALAHRHGLPLAEVLDSVRRDLESSARFAARLRAMMAGPRASAAVLAVLPALGIALGEAMGARPIAVLTTTAGGHVLLAAGAALVLAGTAWCGRLTRQAVPS